MADSGTTGSAPVPTSASGASPARSRSRASMARAARAPMPTASVTKRAMLARSPPAQTRASLVRPASSVHSSAPRRCQCRAQVVQPRVLADGRQHGVGRQREVAAVDRRELEAPRSAPGSKSTRRHCSVSAASTVPSGASCTLQHRPVDQRDALFQRLVDLVALRRHLRRRSSASSVTAWPWRRALRATSMAALPPPTTTTRRPSAGGAPRLQAAR
jgi:hypothetical protein